MRAALILFVAMQTACTQFPQLDASYDPKVAQVPYPKLLPIEDLLTGPEPRADIADIPRIEGRVSGLRARASRLSAVRQQPNALDARVARLRQRANALRAGF